MNVEEFRRLWAELAPIGRTDRGYLRYAWGGAELACRDWFRAQAEQRGMTVEADRNGNLYAWWGDTDADRVVLTGSHFDSVPHGGGYDGPLGIVSGFLAVDALRAEGATPATAIGVAAFAEEEGARFGVPCLGSRLMTGALDPDRARLLTDRDGVPLAHVVREQGLDAEGIGHDPELLQRIAAFVELHIEQGRALVHYGAPVGVASAIWPHGRWRMRFTGESNHAGTTHLDDRRDPMLTFAFAALAARKEARLAGALATVGRVSVDPGATNAVPATVEAWLDARAADEDKLKHLIDAIESKVAERADRDGTGFASEVESYSPVVEFDRDLRDRIVGRLEQTDGPEAGHVPVLATGAGHDAGVLAAHVPTAMLFVRNRTGVSHAFDESATDEDCAAGVAALAAVLRDLGC
jgi:N-carbamoyl-L-amino-acid hydrolase